MPILGKSEIEKKVKKDREKKTKTKSVKRTVNEITTHKKYRKRQRKITQNCSYQKESETFSHVVCVASFTSSHLPHIFLFLLQFYVFSCFATEITKTKIIFSSFVSFNMCLDLTKHRFIFILSV